MLSIADRQRERQLARQERQRAVQGDAVNEEPVPSFPPINKGRLENDPTSRMIANALGEFDVVKSSILKGEAGLIGVDKMPGTPAPSRFQDEDIDTALPRFVQTPEKAPSELFATPQKRPPPRYPVASSQKISIQQQPPVRPTPAKPPLPTSRQFQPPPNAHPVRGLPAETPSRDLDEIFRDMSAPIPIASLAPTPARSEPTPYLQEAPRNAVEHEPVVSDADVEIDLNPRRALGLPIRPLSPVRSIRIPSPVRPRPESPDPRRSLGLNILPPRPLSPIRSVRQPSPVREHVRHGIVPYQESLPRGSTNTSAQPMEISSEDDESGDSSSESEEDVPAKRGHESPKNISTMSPAHTPSWNLGSFIKTTPLNHSINGDMSDNGPPSEPGPLDQREGPRSAASIALSHSDEGQPLTPAALPLGDHLEPSSQIMAQLTDGEMIDISQVVNQFKARKAVSPLDDSDSDGSETKKPFANLLRAVGDKNSEKKTIPKLNLDSGSDLESRSRTLTQHSAPVATLTSKNNEKTIKTEVIRPLNTNEPKMDQNKSKSICQVFRQKGKQTPKQELIQTNGKENQQAAKFTDEWHQQSVLTSGKENIPTQVPVIKCSLKLFLIRRLPTSYSTVDKVIDQVARGSERTLLDKKTSDSSACAKKRTRDLSADAVTSDSEGESPIHRKEEKRKRVDVKDAVNEKKSPNLPSQPITHPSPSVQNVHETNHERTEKGAPSPYVDADQPPGRLEPGFPQSGATVESGYESLPGVGYDQEEYRDWQNPSRVYSSYYETMKMEAEAEPDERDQTDYLSEAKRLKHLADRESDKVLQFILYMEAAMFFILTGVSMDSDGTPPNKGTQNMYKETNNLIKHISQKFRHQDCSTPQGKVLSRLMVLSMKAQAILQLKLYKSKRSEIKEHTRTLNEYFAKDIVPLPAAEIPRVGTNLISPTPSPSGSVNSVGSQSSGGFHPGSRNNDSGRLLDEPGHSSLMVIPVPVPTHSTLMRNHHNVGLLQASLDLWDQADQMVFRTHSEDFFIQLDHEFGSLTLHSTLRELVRIVRAAVERLGNYNRDCAIGRDVNWP